MPEIELFTSNLSPYAHRVRLALLEKEIDFWHTEIDLTNKPEWFLVIAPLGEVPVIRHEDRFIADSTVILEYLDEVYPIPSLRPRDPAKRAMARFWLRFADERLAPAINRCLRAETADEQTASAAELRPPALHRARRAGPVRSRALLDGARAQHRGSRLLSLLRAIPRHSAISACQPAVDFHSTALLARFHARAAFRQSDAKSRRLLRPGVWSR